MNKRFPLFCLTLLPVALSYAAGMDETLLPEKPNVIFIYADDMGKGMISAYGQRQFTTPNIDALIARGTSFDRAYGCMLSAPARASLLTGYHDCRRDKWAISGGGRYIPITDDFSLIPEIEKDIDAGDIALKEGDYYLPQVFKQAGYVTAEVGKLEWGFTATRKQMREHGWDYYYGYLDHVRCHGFYPPFLFDNGEIVSIAGNTYRNCAKSMERESEAACRERWDRNGKAVYSQDLFLDKILTFIRENKNNPFFLFHPTQLPHGPVAIPAVHPELANNPNLTLLEKEYGSMVKMLDDHIGIIMSELRKLGLDKKTIIIFSADNGHELYYSQTGRCEKPYKNMQTGELFDDYERKYYSDPGGDIFNGNAGMAGLKRSNLDGGVHIPLVFYGEGLVPVAQRREDLVSNYDLLPTIADMLNVSLPVGKDGISYRTALLAGEHIDPKRYVVYGSNLGPGIVTNEGWKLRYCKKQGVYELYNLLDDPQERKNLIDKYPEKAEELKAIMLRECDGDLENGVNRYG
ncbi:MAG: sulfatase-like hydrolase/transferase [Parabacteroides gordonii]|uniref:sulfatase-like hydrolase/transferase n=1 Tax=Parabacteroides gordonii TaxID=574930 RepID=UPI003A871DBE